MDLYQLRAFLEAARALNFTRAAEALHVSPSAVSRSVALLERSVRTRLFARTRRRVALTTAGEALKARAERIFDEVAKAGAELAGGAAAPTQLRLASREMITNYLLPGPLRAFQARFPATRFGLYELGPFEMAAALKNDRLDLGFYYADVLDPALEARFLGRLRSHVYAAKGFRGGALSTLPFVAPRSFGADPSAPRADGYPDSSRPRNVVYEAEFLETHRRFVLDGLCVGVLPDLVMEGERGVVALPGPALHRDVWCFRRRGRSLPAAADFLVAEVRKAVSGRSAPGVRQRGPHPGRRAAPLRLGQGPAPAFGARDGNAPARCRYPRRTPPAMKAAAQPAKPIRSAEAERSRKARSGSAGS